jgi:hypothetical protein
MEGYTKILKCISKTRCEGMKWIQLADDRVQWWDFVNITVNFWVHERQGIHWQNEDLGQWTCFFF